MHIGASGEEEHNVAAGKSFNLNRQLGKVE